MVIGNAYREKTNENRKCEISGDKREGAGATLEM
jgi:hypothetical protein